jgi:Gnt-I system low-affinity gluconate transporter
MMDNTIYLLIITVLSILLLLVLVMRLKVHAFIALLLASTFVGLAAGMPFMELISSLQKGMGDILGFIAIVVGLGAILGKLLEVSGGAQTLAHYIMRAFGDKKSTWALMLTGFIVSIPVFLDVGFIILVPIGLCPGQKVGFIPAAFCHTAFGRHGRNAFIYPPNPGASGRGGNFRCPTGLDDTFWNYRGLASRHSSRACFW